jgi:GT2 family glycosyltransferase
MTPTEASDITLLSVTYGKRFTMLREVLASAFDQGVTRAIVVNNGSLDLDVEALHKQYGDRLNVVALGRNSGSAKGFGEGMKAAMASTAQHVLILDDDNILEAGALQTLKDAYARHAKQTPPDKLIVLGHRPYNTAGKGVGDEALYVSGMQPPNSFFGFRAIDIPVKLARRLKWPRLIGARSPALEVPVATAPYSGMLFHRSVLAQHGLPREDFVLYADDTEFSYRVTKAGGRIILVTQAHIRDIEASWHVRDKHASAFEGFLLGEGDLRAYYSVRNQAFFELHCRTHARMARWFNKLVFLTLLRHFAVKHGAHNRHQLLLDAIQDGEAARLGMHPQHPLK